MTVIHVSDYNPEYFSPEQRAALAANLEAGLAEMAAEVEAEPELDIGP